MDRLDELKRAQEYMFKVYGSDIPGSGSVDHVFASCQILRQLVDAETRHVSVAGTGLESRLSQILIECVCALSGRDGWPKGRKEILRRLREDVFAPRNAKYGDSFTDFGAAGVIIRLLDHARVVEKTGENSTMALAHIANYAAMAVMILR